MQVFPGLSVAADVCELMVEFQWMVTCPESNTVTSTCSPPRCSIHLRSACLSVSMNLRVLLDFPILLIIFIGVLIVLITGLGMTVTETSVVETASAMGVTDI